MMIQQQVKVHMVILILLIYAVSKNLEEYTPFSGQKAAGPNFNWTVLLIPIPGFQDLSELQTSSDGFLGASLLFLCRD